MPQEARHGESHESHPQEWETRDEGQVPGMPHGPVPNLGRLGPDPYPSRSSFPRILIPTDGSSAPGVVVKVPDIKVTPPGPKARELLERDKRCPATTTKTSPIVIRRGQGSVVEDVDGNVYIDFTSGISVLNVAHGHPKVVEAVRKQAGGFFQFAGTDFYYAC